MNAAWWWLGLTLAGEHGAWSRGWKGSIPENRGDRESGECLGRSGSWMRCWRAKPAGRELNSTYKKGESLGDEE